MEPMALGSPSGSPLPSSSGYLPTFLLGDTPTAAPRTNTLSPTKGRTSMAFGQSPLGGGGSASFSIQSPEPTPGTNHRSMMHSRFGLPAGTATTGNQQPGLNHNTSVSGPPVQGLFDSFRNEKQLLQTPTKAGGGGQQHSIVGTANQSMLNESYLNNSGFNVSRVMSPIPVSCQQQEYARNTSFVSPLSPQSTSFYHQGGAGNQPSAPTGSNYWITVFGFPQSASTTILSHFSQCGAIIEKVFATANGNWVHLRFTSRLECDKALNYNGKIIAQNLMIGVQYCNDPAIVGKENNVHAGWVHLFFNLVVQLLVGLPLEMVHGSTRIGCVYLAGVLAGSLGTSVFDPEVYLVGASGGVYALLAAHLANVMLNYRNMQYGIIRLLALFLVASWDVGFAIYSRYAVEPDSGAPSVAYVAHLTGALAGLTIGLLVLKNFEQKLHEQLLWWVALGVYAACIIFAVVFNLLNTVTVQRLEEEGEEVLKQHLFNNFGF